MKNLKRYFYIILGMISLGIGVLGVMLPILPTTPFLLLTSFCFARGSKKFEIWFMNTKIYKKYLESFVKEKAMTIKQKRTILILANSLLAFPLILVDNLYMRLVLIVVILFKLYYFIFKIKTIRTVSI